MLRHACGFGDLYELEAAHGCRGLHCAGSAKGTGRPAATRLSATTSSCRKPHHRLSDLRNGTGPVESSTRIPSTAHPSFLCATDFRYVDAGCGAGRVWTSMLPNAVRSARCGCFSAVCWPKRARRSRKKRAQHRCDTTRTRARTSRRFERYSVNPAFPYEYCYCIY